MMEQHLKQRIAYLVEHGGIASDPIEDIRRSLRVLHWLVSAALVLNIARTVYVMLH